MKKISAIILATLVLLMQMPIAVATDNHNALSFDSVYPEANNVVNIAVQQGTIPGLADGQISELYMAGSIPLYEVNGSGTFNEVTDLKYYPVLDQNNIARGMIIAKLQGADATATVEYNTMLTTELSLYKQEKTNICFVFDQTDIYVYDGITCSAVLQGGILDTSRGVMGTETNGLEQLQRTLITAEEQFNLLLTCDPAVSGMLSVPKIRQAPWSNGCWAASAICVGEYSGPSSVSLTVSDVMEEYADGEDVPKTFLTIQNVLDTEYDLVTDVYLEKLMMSTVMDNVGIGMDQGAPVLARVDYKVDGKGHFIVVCGYTSNTYPNTSYVTMMDPLSSSYRTIATEWVGNSSEIKYEAISSNETYGTNLYLTIF